MKKRIVVTISESGDIKLETQGYQGNNCTRETLSLKRALGLETDIILKGNLEIPIAEIESEKLGF